MNATVYAALALAVAATMAAKIIAHGETIAPCMDAGFNPAYCAQYIATMQAPANPDHADHADN